MNVMRLIVVVALLAAVPVIADEMPATMAAVLEASTEADWESVPQERLLYLFLDSGTVVFELAPQFAPKHVANVRTLAAEGYWDGLAVVRAQDNYVVQWGDPHADTAAARSYGSATDRIDGEFFRDPEGLDYRPIDSNDAYAETVGFVDGFPAGSDGERLWLAHCYGMLGAGRANAADSGSGAELYVVTGHAPRHLDRNATLFGRVLHGIEFLSSLPRGGGPLGFYADEKKRVPLRRMRLGTDLDEDEQMQLRRLRTDTQTFARLVDVRRHRREEWFIDPAGHIELCNVPLPVRTAR